MRVQCINVSAMIDAAILYEKGHFSREMYFRFLIPELLPHYEKVVYLDCDLIIKRDISELYINDIGNNIMGVVTNITNNEMYNYAKNVLKIIPERYFNSGVLLINTTQFKKEYVKERCLELLAKMPKLACPDQDVLNMVCYEKVQYLDSKWNFQWHHQWDKSGGALAEYFQEQFDNSWENPYIVHYTSSEKPWKRPDKPLAKQWWAYARKTQCYEEILYRNLNKELYMTEKTETKTSIFMKIPGAIQCYKEHGLKYTAKRVIVHLKRIVK